MMVGPLCRQRNTVHKAKGGVESLKSEFLFNGPAVIAEGPARPVGKRCTYICRIKPC